MRLMVLITILFQMTNLNNLLKKKSFYEHAKIFDNYYGTLKQSVDDLIKTNDIIFDIDWQGTKQLSNFKKI